MNRKQALEILNKASSLEEARKQFEAKANRSHVVAYAVALATGKMTPEVMAYKDEVRVASFIEGLTAFQDAVLAKSIADATTNVAETVAETVTPKGKKNK
jgi:hypothetical protein